MNAISPKNPEHFDFESCLRIRVGLIGIALMVSLTRSILIRKGGVFMRYSVSLATHVIFNVRLMHYGVTYWLYIYLTNQTRV